jgi:hypothetical protein
MTSRFAASCLVPLLLAGWGCEEQQYVNPNTVQLTVTRAGGVTLVQRCNYIPVLLGSAVDTSYHVEGDLGVHLEITRESVRVTFEDSSGKVSSFGEPGASFSEQFSVDIPDPPAGYAATLSSGCAPGPDWPDR